MRDLQAILTIASRDFTKLLRDRMRIVMGLIFPFVFVGVLGGSLQANLSNDAGFNFMYFVFTGVIAQTLFQSTAAGIISLIEDKENDYSQELFVAPISRHAILIGKILGETMVAYTQLIGILIMGLFFGITFTPSELVMLLAAGLLCAFLGGAFGVIVMANLNNQRTANQIFPFLLFPQFFLSGVFTPIKELPPYLFILSRIAPMTYAVDFLRSIYYYGKPEYDKVVLHSTSYNLMAILLFSLFFITLGTYLFIKNERNK